MKAYLVQLDIVWRDKNANFEKVSQMLEGRVEPGSLVVLPEMFATGFDVESAGIVEGESGMLAETGAFLAGLAQNLKSYVQGSGITPAEGGKRQNLVVAYDPQGQAIGTYQKLHPFTFGGEHKRFEAGRGGILYPLGEFQVAPFICYDLRFPEVFRHAALAGAKVITVAANWPSARHAHWLPLLQARAIENQCYVLGVNRVGKDKHLSYCGQSVAFGPRGEQLALADEEECVLEVDLNLDAVEAWRKEFPALQDVRKEFLGLTY
jgi:predicted amidohydrolase